VTGRNSTISDNRIIPLSEHGIDAQQLCANATEVVRRLQEAGYDAYIVGGGVRDLLLGKSPKDFDIATDATPEEVREVFPRSRLIGRRFRLAHVRMRGSLLEVATFRGSAADEEVNQNRRGRILRDNVWGSLAEDAVRRDFTINALFLDPVSGEIRDDVGGYGDLRDRRLRLIGDPETRYREDPVRLLRAARFLAKLDLDLEHETAEPVRRLAPLLEDIPPARLFEELCKLFLTGHAEGSMKALQKLGLTRALFPVLPPGAAEGEVQLDPLVWRALENTDRRIADGLSVTPAFLVAALLWDPVQSRAAGRQAEGATEYQALEQTGDEVLALQVRRTAVPRRFSSVTRQIWLNQARMRRTRGKRSLSILQQPRFRAAYDFLLLRAEDDPELAPLAEFWTEAQKDPELREQLAQQAPRRRRRPRRRPRSRRGKEGAADGRRES
jgi:poly(A) polymerase